MRLSSEFLGDTRTFPSIGGVVLSHFVHLTDGSVDLADALALLGAGLGDFRDEIVHAARLVHHVGQALGDLVTDLQAAVAFLDGVFDFGSGFASGFGAALGQVTNFVRHDGEAEASLTSPGGFHGGIEREDVRLEGDLVNGLDNLADAVIGTF